MAKPDWTLCPAVESVADRRSGAWVFTGTRMPVATVFEDLEAGSSIEEIIEQFHVTRDQIQDALGFCGSESWYVANLSNSSKQRDRCAPLLITGLRAK